MMNGSPPLRLAATLAAGTVLLAASGRAADVPWAIKGASYRAVVRLKEAPANPDAGVEISVPDLGVVRPHGGGYALTDATGHPVPVAVASQAETQAALLLASGLQSGQDYYLYVGGPVGTNWTPKVSLLQETRASPYTRGETFGSWGALQSAWGNAPTQGARFDQTVFSGNNPFGEPTNFLAHYSGYLAPTNADNLIATSSWDASFVLVNDQLFLDAPGKHPLAHSLKELHTKKLPASAVPIKIDYYYAKGNEGDPGLSLIWLRNGRPEAIPEDAWLHPGTSETVRYEAVNGGPVPAARVKFGSYVGWGGGFLYETHCALEPTDLTDATVEWRFSDGGVFTGSECTRLLAANPPLQTVTVVAKRGAGAAQAVGRINLYGSPPEKTAEGDEAHQRYLGLLARQNPATLTAPMLATALPFLIDNGQDAQITPWANAWLNLKRPPGDPLWAAAESAHLRAVAETNPKAALAEMSSNATALGRYGKAFELFEIELIVFYAHDLSMLPRVQQIAFDLGDTPEGRLAAIRIGDLYRLNGDLAQAIDRYKAAQPTDPAQLRKLPAEEQANSLTVSDLIESGDRQAAEAKLAAWELADPMAKFTADFLLLRSRLMGLYGRWRESLTELNVFAGGHPDSPYQIEVDFHRARALYELGQKDEARKIWSDLIKNYPKSEYATSSREWLNKS